jgi:hypothetical protein
MFGWFGNKKKDKGAKGEAVDVSHLSDAKQKLMAQMREVRAEIGEEELVKMNKAIQMDKLKRQVRHDIETDEDKRNRLLDEIRFNINDDK